MEIDEDKVDDAVLALLRLTLHDGRRAWKGFDWDALDRLHRKGLIGDPVGKSEVGGPHRRGASAVRDAACGAVWEGSRRVT